MFHELKVTLTGIAPPVWRRLRVRSDMSLGFLHAALQVAIGWTNSHLHHFIIGGQRYADPRMNEERLMDEEPDLDEWKSILARVLPKGSPPFFYEYDFGDSWRHIVELERVLAEDSFSGLAQCVDGARACPPEDCGGIGGYERLLVALRDPNHEEHESKKEWLGGSFDPETFDLGRTNKHLQKLKSPRLTDGQLARVLMARDADPRSASRQGWVPSGAQSTERTGVGPLPSARGLGNLALNQEVPTMSRDFPESDWRVFKRVHAEGYERFCRNALGEIEAILRAQDPSAAERFDQVARFLAQCQKEMRRAFGDYRRSTAMIQLHVMRALKILGDDDLADFTEPTRRSIQTWNP